MTSHPLATLLALVTLALGGCAVATQEPEPATGEAAEGLKSGELCPMVFEPVCGKDGVTYSNACEAGTGNVAYDGECVDPCAAVLCLEGTTCTVQGGKARCVAERGSQDACATVRCAAGTHCESKGQRAECVADEPTVDACATVRCAAGTHCELVQVQCVMAPCDPIAECVAD